MVYYTTFNNISAISSRSLLLVEETGLSVISIKCYISGSTQTQFFFTRKQFPLTNESPFELIMGSLIWP
jgi:hypothetical protein